MIQCIKRSFFLGSFEFIDIENKRRCNREVETSGAIFLDTQEQAMSYGNRFHSVQLTGGAVNNAARVDNSVQVMEQER